MDVSKLSLDVNENYKPLDEPWDQLALKNFGETPDKVKKSIAEVKKFIEADGGLTCPLGDAFLVRFLRSRDYDVKETYLTIRRYCKMLTTKPKLFKVVPSTIEDKLMKQDMSMVMPKRMPDGRLLICGRLGSFDPAVFPVKDAVRMAVLFGHYLFSDPFTQVSGTVNVVDMKGLKMSHVKLLTPKLAHDLVRFAEKCFPASLNTVVHVVNNSNVFEAGVKFVLQFASKDHKEKIKLHGEDLSSLHKCVSPDLLPTEFGGTAGPMGFEAQNKSVMAVAEKLTKLMECEYDPKKGKKQ